MNITRAIIPAAFGVLLASCGPISSNLPIPSFDPFSETTDGILMIDSNPRDAVARPSTGGVCRTPCELSVPLANAFTVTYELEGYLPRTVTVRPVPVPRTALIDVTPPRLEPNPVMAELKPAPPPPPEPPPAPNRQRR
jgi:hypothetical protein